MADTFHDLNEAAKLLNVTPDKLTQMRDNGEIRGFRDGSTWKFKTEEVQRLLDQQAGKNDSAELGFEDEGDDEVTMLGEAPDLAAIIEAEDDDSESSAELGSAASLLINGTRDRSGASVIGDGKTGSSSPENDLEISKEESDSASGDDDANVLDDSELLLQEEGGTGELTAGEKEENLTFDSSELDDSNADMELSDDDFSLSDDDLVLSTSDSEDSVLTAGISDITLGSGDSGINLQRPSDSGISLDEEPMELAGGSSSALGLPEEDSGLSLGDDLSDSEDFANLQKDDEFLLSPSDEGFGDSSDSGSQVIALSDSQAFDEDAATMIADRMFEEDPLDAGMLLTEEPDMAADAAAGLGDEMDPTYAAAGVGGLQQEVLPPVQAVEASYSIWNLMGLFCILLLLILTGVSMTDVVRNMWSWQEPYEVSNSVMNLFLPLFEAIKDLIG